MDRGELYKPSRVQILVHVLLVTILCILAAVTSYISPSSASVNSPLAYKALRLSTSLAVSLAQPWDSPADGVSLAQLPVLPLNLLSAMFIAGVPKYK